MSDVSFEAVTREIRRRSDNFASFFRAGDAAGLVADYYVDEPQMSAPDMPLLTSRAAITGLFEELMKGFSACDLTQHDVRVSGERAYELGIAIVTPKDASAPKVDCRYVIVWRKAADGWRVELDFFAFGKLI
ncbi:YybH family protein [Govanella unica]|uniref:DUF4440 domain-containing protein n=1 Tax=Govanella unica TaxID=2975056 RepID=A0A9X3TWY2_9PROT|nr:DUF4440 domain-containing protein [Govania unica]MDA5193476.1 DUF4440 domain-containing protein [Govania unica]